MDVQLTADNQGKNHKTFAILFQSLYCIISRSECKTHFNCLPIINLLNHLQECDSLMECSSNCNNIVKIIRHCLTCNLINCICMQLGDKNENNQRYMYLKTILSKSQLLTWRRKLSPHRTKLVMKVTNYISSHMNDQMKKENLVAQIWNNITQLENSLFILNINKTTYINRFLHNCNDLLTKLVIRKIKSTNPDLTNDEINGLVNETLQFNELDKIIYDFTNWIVQTKKEQDQQLPSQQQQHPQQQPIQEKEQEPLKQEEKENKETITNIKNEKNDVENNENKEKIIEKNNNNNVKQQSPSISSPMTPPIFKGSPTTNNDNDQSTIYNETIDRTNIKIWNKTELYELFISLHRQIWDEYEAEVFHYPVDWQRLKIPDYPTIIKNPMDLSTIRNKLQGGYYTDPWEVVNDFWLMFNNAWLFNKKNSRVYKICTAISKIFESQIDELMQSVGYCCGRDYVYLPQVLVCCTPQMCFVNRDQIYYCIDNDCTPKLIEELGSDRYICCEKCFTEAQDDSVELMISESVNTLVSVQKKLFECLKNNVKEPEELIACRSCGRRWHQVCANHLDEIWRCGFFCPSCVNKRPLHHSLEAANNNPFLASKLPKSQLGDYLEAAIDRWRANKVEHIPKIIIRLLSVTEKITEVRPQMKAKFVDTGEMPETLPYRLKSVYVFQEQPDKTEICIFGLQTQEYNSECPEPNRNRIYIAYIDSVQYFQPSHLRTPFYHRIIIEYLRYCGQIGYKWAHIWACPPADGDDYIFHVHPPQQKLPRPRRLQEWYTSLLLDAVREQAVKSFDGLVQSMVDTFYMTSLSELPYFDGDYWPSVLEEMLGDGAIENDDDSLLGIESCGPPKKRKLNKYQKSRSISYNGLSSSATSTASSTNSLSQSEFNTPSSSNSVPIIDNRSLQILNTMDKRKENFFIVELNTDKAPSFDTAKNDKDKLGYSELMEGRDRFLALAREKHLEFGTLRRAKFATLSLCYELHLEWRGGVIYSCNRCGLILDGVRFECGICNEYELCETCSSVPEVHSHDLRRVSGEDNGILSKIENDNSETTITNTDNNNQENSNIQSQIKTEDNPPTKNPTKVTLKPEGIIELVRHASNCQPSDACPRNDCKGYKNLELHSKTCQIRNSSECKSCLSYSRVRQICRRYTTMTGTPIQQTISVQQQQSQQQPQSQQSQAQQQQTVVVSNQLHHQSPSYASQVRLRQMVNDRRRIQTVRDTNTVASVGVRPIGACTNSMIRSNSLTMNASPEIQENIKAIQQFVRHLRSVNPNISLDQQKLHLQQFLDRNPVLKQTYEACLANKLRQREQLQLANQNALNNNGNVSVSRVLSTQQTPQATLLQQQTNSFQIRSSTSNNVLIRPPNFQSQTQQPQTYRSFHITHPFPSQISQSAPPQQPPPQQQQQQQQQYPHQNINVSSSSPIPSIIPSNNLTSLPPSSVLSNRTSTININTQYPNNNYNNNNNNATFHTNHFYTISPHTSNSFVITRPPLLSQQQQQQQQHPYQTTQTIRNPQQIILIQNTQPQQPQQQLQPQYKFIPQKRK